MDSSALKAVSQNLKLLRVIRNISQADMADAVGLTRSGYAQYELGNRVPDAQSLLMIARVFRINMELLFETNPDKFISEISHTLVHGENDELLLENYRLLSPFSKGRLFEFSEKLVEADKLKEENLRALEERRHAE